MVVLPRGVGLVRISSPLGVVTMVSDRLTRKEEEVARIMATALSLNERRPIVVLRETDIARTLEETA